MTRPDQFATVYLDSCVFIRHIVEPEKYPEIGDVFRLIDAGVLTGWISAIHWVEVLGKQRAEAFNPERERMVQQLLTNPRLQLVDVAPHILQQARELALRDGFKPMDAIHVASAVDAQVDILMTYDDKDYRLGRRLRGVWIDRPYEPGGATLFSGQGESVSNETPPA